MWVGFPILIKFPKVSMPSKELRTTAEVADSIDQKLKKQTNKQINIVLK